ncbi:MAG: hypothetical protein CL735_00555 [Chloroflexi bacterium]|mgnify:FL=1|nr:hypothetical protein [Chloroflexota bacterium]|tara:strand:- start:95835 stop:96200 length:366 start_codon:yes stop_codon:yes gene_type:complete
MINSIGGIIIWTEKGSFTKMVEFYSQILDLKIHSQRDDFVVFSWKDMRLSLGVHSELYKKNHDPLRIMVNFLTEDIELAFQTLSLRGVEFVRIPMREHWGGWVSTFKDPDGNFLQLLQLEN